MNRTHFQLSTLSLLLACGGAPPLAPTRGVQHVDSTKVSLETEAELPKVERELQIERMPAWGRPRLVGTSGGIYIAGGFRLKKEGDTMTFANDVLGSYLEKAARLPSANGGGDVWWFVEQDGHLWKSDTFLGDLTHVPTPTSVTALFGSQHTELMLLSGDGQLLELKGGQPVVVASAAKYVISEGRIEGGIISITDLMGTTYQSPDGGATFSEVKSPATNTPLMGSRPNVGRMSFEEADEIYKQAARRFPALTARNDRGEEPAPENCSIVTKGVAQCEMAINVYAVDAKRWVIAVENLDTKNGHFNPSPIRSVDGSEFLFGMGCGGEYGQLCRVSASTGDREHIRKYIPTQDAFGLVGDTLLIGAPWTGNIARVNLKTGEAASSFYEGRMQQFMMLQDGTVSGKSRDGSTYLLPEGEAKQPVRGPKKAKSTKMLTAKLGLATNQTGQLFSTTTGGATWNELPGTCSDEIRCANQVCSCAQWVARVVSAPSKPATALKSAPAASDPLIPPFMCDMLGERQTSNLPPEPVFTEGKKKTAKLGLRWTFETQRLAVDAVVPGVKFDEGPRADIVATSPKSVLTRVCTSARCGLFLGKPGGKTFKEVNSNGRARTAIALSNGDIVLRFDATGARRKYFASLAIVKNNGAFKMLDNKSEVTGIRETKKGIELLYKPRPRMGYYGYQSRRAQTSRMIAVGPKGKSRVVRADIATALHTPCKGDETGERWQIIIHYNTQDFVLMNLLYVFVINFKIKNKWTELMLLS